MRDLFKKLRNIKDQRYKQAINTSSVSFIAQIVQMFTAVVSVPLVLNAVGNERYGLWMTLSSILLFVTFSDFGMGIGMQNILTYAKAIDDREKIKKAFNTTLSFGFVLFLILLLVAYLLLPILNLSVLFKYQDPSIAKDILPTTQAVIIVLSLGILSGLIQRTFDSFQEGYYSRIILLVARILSLLLLFWAVKAKQGLAMIILVSNGFPNLLLFLGILILYKKYDYLLFRFKDISKAVFFEIFRTGILGLGASIAIFLLSSITPMLISAHYGLQESAKYMILMRLLNFVILFVNMAFLPLWPAVADAYIKKDHAWLNLLYLRINKIFLIIGLPTFISLLAGSKWLILFWTHNKTVLPSFLLICICVIYTILSVWNTIICVFLNGMSLFKGQATYGVIVAAMSIFIAHLTSRFINSEGVVLVITLGMLIRCVYLHFELKNNMVLKMKVETNV